MYKIAIIGAGIISDFHVQGWKNIPNIEIHTVVDLNEDLAKEKAEKWGAKNFETDYQKVLQNPEVTICDICLPHFLHAKVTIDALNAGKNVLCEKPIALNIDEALKVQEAEKASGKLLMIGENWYYIPSIQKAYEIYKSGKIGEAYNFRANLDFPGVRQAADQSSYTRIHSWRGNKEQCGGGILLDAGIHTLSVGRWFMGEAEEITGSFGKQVNDLKDGLEDSFSAVINYKNKSTGLFHFAEPAGYSGSFDFKILGEKGVIEIDIFKELVRVNAGDDKEEYVVKAKGGMTEEMEHFIECLEKGNKPISDSDDQIRSLALVFAAYESANNKCVPVKVNKFLNTKTTGVNV
jgi:UDP-N-acetylglucosamine 3-dehydrogenase